MRHDDRVPPAPEQLLTEGSSLRWSDAVIASGLAIAGGLAVVTALHRGAIPGVLANYMAHAWMAAIALAWFFLFNRKFPIGGLNQGQLRPWYVLSLVLVAANAVETFVSPPGAHLHVPNPPTLVAELVFLAFVVGPTEELLFRGLIQTSLNASIRARVSLHGWQLGLGTVIAAVLFGLFHLVNLGYQPLGTTLQQVVTSVVIGLVFGLLYDRTRNLVGASLAHSLTDFSGTAIPLLAYVLASR
jgi:membrane protease YdiL (CAAX protease family)